MSPRTFYAAVQCCFFKKLSAFCSGQAPAGDGAWRVSTAYGERQADAVEQTATYS